MNCEAHVKSKGDQVSAHLRMCQQLAIAMKKQARRTNPLKQRITMLIARAPDCARCARVADYQSAPRLSHHFAKRSMVNASVLRPSGEAKMRSKSSSRSKTAWP